MNEPTVVTKFSLLGLLGASVTFAGHKKLWRVRDLTRCGKDDEATTSPFMWATLEHEKRIGRTEHRKVLFDLEHIDPCAVDGDQFRLRRGLRFARSILVNVSTLNPNDAEMTTCA